MLPGLPAAAPHARARTRRRNANASTTAARAHGLDLRSRVVQRQSRGQSLAEPVIDNDEPPSVRETTFERPYPPSPPPATVPAPFGSVMTIAQVLTGGPSRPPAHAVRSAVHGSIVCLYAYTARMAGRVNWSVIDMPTISQVDKFLAFMLTSWTLVSRHRAR